MIRSFHANNVDRNNNQDTTQSKEKSRKIGTFRLITIISAVLVIDIGGIFVFLVFRGNTTEYQDANNGAVIVSVDDSMSDEEIQEMLAKQATTMRIHVWQAPAINGDVLSLGFENSASNTYDQAFRVIQNDETIYESWPVSPGDSVKDVECPKARVGRAVVEIFNVVAGSVYGNGVRCEVVIIGTDNDGNKADRVEDAIGVLYDMMEASTENN